MATIRTSWHQFSWSFGWWGHWHSPSLCLQSTTTWQGLRGLWLMHKKRHQWRYQWTLCESRSSLPRLCDWNLKGNDSITLYPSHPQSTYGGVKEHQACDIESFWVAMDADNIHIADTQLIKTPEAVRPVRSCWHWLTSFWPSSGQIFPDLWYSKYHATRWGPKQPQVLTAPSTRSKWDQTSGVTTLG